MPYGMPSGAELRSLICNPALADVLYKKFQIDPIETTGFIKSFSRSNVASIDSFLSKRGHYAEIGKLCIATILCGKEDSAKVMGNNIKDHWYHHMWQILIDGADTHNDLRKNKIDFVTFNYDRSLEYFLHQSTKHTFGVADSEALAVVKNINILHVYGSLGEFNFIPAPNARQYTNELVDPAIRIASNGIKIIPEARNDDVAFEAARSLFENAEVIGFLGFGFDTLNIERLGLGDVLDWRSDNKRSLPSIIASTYRKTNAESIKIRQLLWPSAPESSDYIHTYNLENTTTIRESVLLD